MKEDAYKIIQDSIQGVLPDKSVERLIKEEKLRGNFKVIAIGKAAWTMAKSAADTLGEAVIDGIIITKYEHSKGDIDRFQIYEAGHPITDDRSVRATQNVLEYIKNIKNEEKILFLISGGGSALFEKPEDGVNLDDIKNITKQLLSCGASITEINTIRKRLSAVKGGKFSALCADTEIISIVLSDVIGDDLDVIASGPVFPDRSTSEEALKIIEKYSLDVNDDILNIIKVETPKEIRNTKYYMAGNVYELCRHASEAASKLGYKPYILTTVLECEAREAGRFLAAIAKDIKRGTSSMKAPCAIILGGETTVQIKGEGKGGRNQELALSAAKDIESLDNLIIVSVGSDGTDGPTDAAGGIVDGRTAEKLKQKNISIDDILEDNDSYHALKEVGGLIMTGPTGTNVNDLMFALIK